MKYLEATIFVMYITCFNVATGLSSPAMQRLKRSFQHSTPREFESWRWKNNTINYIKSDGINQKKCDKILLIHGFGSCIGHYCHNVKSFSEAGYDTFALDLLGFGASDKPFQNVTYSVELWKDLVVDFIEEKSQNPNEKWILCGNSLGGLITLYVTSLLQSRIKSCVILNSSGALTVLRYEDMNILLRPLWWFLRNIIFGDFLGALVFKFLKMKRLIRLILRQVYYQKKVSICLVDK